MAKHDLDPDGSRLPIRIDSTSNGEFLPTALTAAQELTNRFAHDAASENAQRLGLGRRAFLVTSAGAATTLAACNAANPGAGGRYALPAEAVLDEAAAASVLTGDEFIFDVQTHCVDPSGAWRVGRDGEIWDAVLRQAFGQYAKCGESGFDCYSAQTLAKEVYLDSDTDVAVVSALWGSQKSNPTPTHYAAEAREIIEAIGGDGARCLIHGGLLPNDPGDFEAMEEKARVHRVDAWKMYPQWGPEGRGFFLDESDYAARAFEEARRLGVTTIAVHKGIPLFGLEYEYSSPKDMGPAAKQNPDLTFLVYHSGMEHGKVEGPYNPEAPVGIDRLIKSHQDAGFKPNEGNLYAELGSTWRHFMGRPDEAAHVLGKLLKYFGEERIMWGSDSIWFGSPQDQIQAFRAFEISAEYQERFGYPALTAEAKRKIFGLNGARVYGLDVARLSARNGLTDRRLERRERQNPSFATYGPKTRRDFMALWQEYRGRPG
ncbi:amidohydrolase family protein [Altererythrobacter arenosus]|uniref:Amidohydrolase family protein n=1 Tax=Altererythrobacter arenosus TaxID=3032592 RepID=A0ABY8FQC7_9SPHN|nr:amidohydrolase family protein [Altererythrobacter sp. CAU 1644]WFL76450.1 amidohydrolase family protein [Altererythrobacter sp. CAU 1644]